MRWLWCLGLVSWLVAQEAAMPFVAEVPQLAGLAAGRVTTDPSRPRLGDGWFTVRPGDGTVAGIGELRFVLRSGGREVGGGEFRGWRLHPGDLWCTEQRWSDGLRLQTLWAIGAGHRVVVLAALHNGTAAAVDWELQFVGDAAWQLRETSGRASPAPAVGADTTAGAAWVLTAAELPAVPATGLLHDVVRGAGAAAARCLRVEGDAAPFAAFVRDGVADLLACRRRDGSVGFEGEPASIEAQGGPLLVFLRSGRWDEARAVLVAEHGAFARAQSGAAPAGDAPPLLDLGEPTAACWMILHHYWYLRCTGDRATVAAHLPVLEAAIRRIERRDEVLLGPAAGPWRLRDSVLFVHAVASLGGIGNGDVADAAAGAPAPGAQWTRRALQLMDGLEQRFWLPSHSRFAASIGTTGAAATAATAADNLLPASIGWLTQTGSRAVDNLTASLRELWCDDGRPRQLLPAATPVEQACALAAAVHLGIRERDVLLRELLRQTPARPDQLGLALDQVLFATSGLRLATAPDLDERWLRLRPALAPGARHMAFHNLRAERFCGDLFVNLTDAGATSDQPPRLGMTLVQTSPDDGDGKARLVVLHCGGTQFQEHVRQGVPMVRSDTSTPGAGLLPAR